MSIPTIRPAQPSDARALTACFEAAYAPFLDLDGLPDVTSGLAEDIARRPVFVAEDGGALLGGAILMVDGRVGHLGNLAVAPESQGRGVARLLIDAVEAHCRDAGIDVLRLATHADMGGNVALYAHLGFREIARRGRKVEMEKRLGP